MAIGQHPQLYSLPEIYLGIVDTLDEWLALALQPRRKYMNQGLLRVVAQLHYGEQTEETVLEAQSWLKQRRQWSTSQMFHYLAERIAPRQLVDKSPTQGKLENLERLHQIFPRAYFLHLTRHPRSTGNSLLKGRPNLNLLTDMIEEHWVRIHHNILRFTDSLPHGQAMRLQGENLLAEPDIYFPQVAEWLEIRADADAIKAMKHPETSPYAHVGPPSAPHGNNRGFLEEPYFKIGRPSPVKLAGPMEWSPNNSGFSPETLRIARQLGYD